MKRLILALVFSAIPSLAFASEGPEVFTTQKCNACHSVKVAKVGVLPGAAEKAPDLSKVGSKYDKKAIALFVLKKTEHNGEKHKKLFEGQMEDLKVIALWLENLK